MMKLRQLLKSCTPAIVAGILLLIIDPLQAAGNPLRRIIDDMEIYMGVLPAEIVRGHPRHHAERQMHGGVPAGAYHHIMVALFDSKTGARISDASITATVKGYAAADSSKKLEPMMVAGVLTYGNYFKMAGFTKQNRILLEIRRAESNKVIRTTFQWTLS